MKSLFCCLSSSSDEAILFAVNFKGAVLCARFSVDSPYALAVGGTKNGFQILDVRQLESGPW